MGLFGIFAKTVGGSAAEAAAKAAAEAAAKASAETAAKAAAEAAAKAVAEAAAKASAEAAAKASAEAAAKAAAEAAAKASAEAAAKAAAEAAAKASAEATAKRSATLVTGGKYAVGGAVLVGGVYYMASPALESLKKNGAILGITSITKGSSNNTANITYIEPIDMDVHDTVTLSETNSVPPINGEYSLTKIVSKTQIVVTLPGNTNITTPGTSGKLTLHTNEANQRNLLNASITGGIGDVLKPITDFLSGIWDSFGNVFKYIFLFILIIIVLKIMFTIYGIWKKAK